MSERPRIAKERRRYVLRKRAERQDETRRRITEAALRLHASIGIARTTVADVAREAGVERVTVYRHFPDQVSLLTACSGLHGELHPMPDPMRFEAISDRGLRLRAALLALYAYYREFQGLLRNVHRDLDVVPAVREVFARRGERVEAIARLLLEGRPDSQRLRAAVGHALAFPTWDSLCVRSGLADADAVELLAGLIELAAAG